MNAEIYDALIAAGAPEDNLRGDIKKIELEIKRVEAQVHNLDKNMAVMKWMLGIVMIATVFPLIKDLF